MRSRRRGFLLVAAVAALVAVVSFVLPIPGDVGSAPGVSCGSLGRGASSAYACEGHGLVLRWYFFQALALSAFVAALAVRAPRKRWSRTLVSLPLALLFLLAAFENFALAADPTTLWSLSLFGGVIAVTAGTALFVVWFRHGVTKSRRWFESAPLALTTAVMFAAVPIGLDRTNDYIQPAVDVESSQCGDGVAPVVTTANAAEYEVAFSSRNESFVVADLQGNRRTTLSPRYLAVDEPGWSSNGKRVVWSDGTMRLAERRPDGTVARRTLGVGEYPSLSPDGDWVAYERKGRLVVRRLADNRINDLGRATDLDDPPSWSPDGRSLAFTSGDYAFVTKRVGGDRVRLPTVAGGIAGNPMWSPDGRLIAYSDGQGLSVVRPDGSGHRTISVLSRNAFEQLPRWSPDSTYVSYLWTHLDRPGGFVEEVCVVPVAPGGKPWALLAPENRGRQAPEWSPDGRMILIATGETDDTLSAFDLVTHQTLVIAEDAIGGQWIPVEN